MTKKDKKTTLLLGILFVLFAIVAFCFPIVDQTITKEVVAIRTNSLTSFFKVITYLGETESIIVIGVLALMGFAKKKERVLIVCNSLGIYLFNQLLKMIVARPRPDKLIALVEENNYSFTSGHTIVSTALFGLILMLISRKIKSKRLKYILAIIVALIVLLIAFSRVYLGVHYYTDVICGLLLALILLNIEKSYLK